MNTQTSFKMIPGIVFYHGKPWVIMGLLVLFVALSVVPVTALDIEMRPAGQTEINGPISILNLDQFAPAVTYARPPVDEYLVVFEEVHSATDYDIYAIRVDSAGNSTGSLIPIDYDAYLDTHPGVAFNPATNKYLVVWENEYELNATDHDIYAQLIAADGSLDGGEIHVAYTTAYDAQPVVTYNPGMHEYLVVFERRAGNPELYHQDLIAQRIYEDGTLRGDEITIANGLLDEQAPAVASDGIDYLVVWQGDLASTNETNIYGQRIGADGSLLGGQIPISTWEGDQLEPKVTYNLDDGHYFVVWEDHHFTPWGIYGYRLDQLGNLLEPQVTVASGAVENRTNPDVAYLPAIRSYQVVWQFEFYPDDHDIYTRRVAYDGSHPENETYITQEDTEEKRPAVASNAGDRLMTVWEDWRNYATSGVDIYGSVETMPVLTLSGSVYLGAAGVTTNPLPGVTVQLGCSNDQGVFGSLVTQTVTNDQGHYVLPAYILCEYYNILQVDLDGYYSTGSQSVSGEIYSSNWIYHIFPLDGDLSGNNFWDQVQGPVDNTPPGNWANFQPNNWVNTQTILVSEQVEDTQSGLDVSTAEFRYSIDGGTSWANWSAAMITGEDQSKIPQLISANVPFSRDSESQNLIQFRVADMIPNLGVSSSHVVKIDSILPLNPTSITSSSHIPNVCSKNTAVKVEWSGASDDRSGIFGYSTSWNQIPDTIPDIYRDIDKSPMTNNAYFTSSSWWFHVRTLDNAGNAASGAVHYGPFCVDIDPPTAWITTPGGQVNLRTINIGWAGGDTLSGVSSFDVQSNINGAGWTNWQINTQATSAAYTGDNGKEISFRVRAHDTVGNIGEWSTPVSVTFGVAVTVRVQNENGSYLQSAKVYRQGKLMGFTDSSGFVTVQDTLIGDTLAALYLVHVEPAAKSSHGMDGLISWAWRVYQTSIRIPNDGIPQLSQVTNTGLVQQLTVRKDQPMIGVHMIVVVQWDASSSLLDEIRQGLVSASGFLYDVTDGQMFFETIELYDDGVNGPANDMYIYTDTGVWPPNAFVKAITQPTGRMMFPPTMGPPWSSRVAYGAIIHEFGHYGLWLDDEYLDRLGKGGGFCTFNQGTDKADEPTRASIMDHDGISSELCSRADPNHMHNTNTSQDAYNKGETTWETVMRVYKDKAVPSDWTLQSPDTRSIPVMAGPNTLPIPDLVTVYVFDSDTNVCDPYIETFYTYNAMPAKGASVFVSSYPNSVLIQGLTDAAGKITIRGAHNGDTLGVTLGNSSTMSTINCTPTSLELQSRAIPQSVIIQPDPFTLELTTIPLNNISIQVQADPSAVLPSAPQAQLWQDGSTDLIDVPLSYDNGLGLYVGQATLESSLDLRGVIRVIAADAQGYEVTRTSAFSIQSIDPDNTTWLRSNDGRLEILLQAESFISNPIINIQPATAVNMQQGSLNVIGNAYVVTTSTGENSLQVPASLNIYFSGGDVDQGYTQVQGLYQWNATNQNWVLISTDIDTEHNFISAQIAEFGTYAILGTYRQQIILPIIHK